MLVYGLALAVLLALLRWLELHFIIFDHAFEIYIGTIALLFTALGIWLASRLIRPKTVVIEKEIIREHDFRVNEKEIERLGLSAREMEVLQAMSDGLSNQEIADRLYLSLNTIKTHSSRLFEKLDVKRRTQAVEKAKRCGLLP